MLRVVLASSKYPNTNSNLVQIHFSEHSGKAFLPVMLSYNASYFSDMLLFYIEIVVIKENGGGELFIFHKCPHNICARFKYERCEKFLLLVRFLLN